MRGRSFAGALLVVIGVALLLINLTGVGGVAIVLLGGLAFLATYLATRTYGFLVPGGILTGFGGALVAQDLGLAADIGLIGLGVGFLLILLVQSLSGAALEAGWWWPVIPGGILVLLGVIDKLEGSAAGLVLPAMLIILGLSFLLSAAWRGVPSPDADGADGAAVAAADASEADTPSDPSDPGDRDETRDPGGHGAR